MKPDHIHVFVDVPQTVAPCVVVRTFKDISAIELFKAFPQRHVYDQASLQEP